MSRRRRGTRPRPAPSTASRPDGGGGRRAAAGVRRRRRAEPERVGAGAAPRGNFALFGPRG
jgi:hypothetical protein